ncbi:hypothetical protein [Streptomyces peucetius]|uniref:Uncharacterized protein n=1 Tax=Streptomyces peucetius TaxID=1950 RepID=A0ABY6I300_STRPE|nr:hypothetical protein [Streptomyces peucetius]UYQ60130.1 hypothetical protein OGH68_00660 [Streptomyces peucetius]
MDPLTPEDPARIGPFRLLCRLGSGTTPVIDSATAADPPWVAVADVPEPALKTVVDEEEPLPP